MSGPVSERGGFLTAQQFGGDYTTPGATVSMDFYILPAFVVAHVGLARVAAAEAAIGIVEITGDGGTVNFGPENEWETAIYQNVSRFTIGAFAARGVMKGWYFIQVWE